MAQKKTSSAGEVLKLLALTILLICGSQAPTQTRTTPAPAMNRTAAPPTNMTTNATTTPPTTVTSNTTTITPTNVPTPLPTPVATIDPQNETGTEGISNKSKNATDNNAESTSRSSCPRYQRGNPALRNMSGCETGTSLDPVDHVTAFGFSRVESPDWNSCGLPELPQTKYVHVAYCDQAL